MHNILSDSKKYVKSSVVDEKHLNFIIGTEKKLNNLLKELKASETTSEINYKNLNQEVPVLVFYMCKTHIKALDKYPPFRLILSTIKRTSYN